MDTLETTETGAVVLTSNEQLEFKSLVAQFKADQSGKTRTFSAVVAAYELPDYGRDIIRYGAFAESIKAMEAKGGKFPVVWNHHYYSIDGYIGTVNEIAELAPGDSRLPAELKDYGGLWVKGEFDGDERSQKSYDMLKGGRVQEFSFGYLASGKSYEMIDGIEYRILTQIDLWEVGPTLRGEHPNTMLTEIKARKELLTSASSAPVQEKSNSALAVETRLRLLDL